jgi:hypothetical protein
VSFANCCTNQANIPKGPASLQLTSVTKSNGRMSLEAPVSGPGPSFRSSRHPGDGLVNARQVGWWMGSGRLLRRECYKPQVFRSHCENWSVLATTSHKLSSQATHLCGWIVVLRECKSVNKQ